MTSALLISVHAICRYQERVRNVSAAEARSALRSPAISLAADIGAPFVKLGTGQRVVLVGRHVVTVLAKDHAITGLATCRDSIHGRRQ